MEAAAESSSTSSGSGGGGGPRLGGGGGFTRAFSAQNLYMETAIKSLDELNEQIVQFVFSPSSTSSCEQSDFPLSQREKLKTSMELMRRLLVDAQDKFRNMVKENKQLASHIDDCINGANQEVNILREELNDTNKMISQMSEPTTCPACNRGYLSTQAQLRSRSDEEAARDDLRRAQRENAKLEQKVKCLQQEVTELRSVKAESCDHQANQYKLELIQTQQELSRLKEALSAMKSDRRRLKAEKVELLNQMKQLYGTLEDKEGELRDFIRNYEQRMRESDDSIKQLVIEKEESEREKWEILKRAREAAERAVSLRTELDLNQHQVYTLSSQLSQVRDEMLTMTVPPSQSDSSHLTTPKEPSPGPASASFTEELPPYQETPPVPTIRTQPKPETNKDDSYVVIDTSSPKEEERDESNYETLSQLKDLSQSSDEFEIGGNRVIISSVELKKTKRKSAMGSLSKVFGKNKARRSLITGQQVDEDGLTLTTNAPRVSMLCDANFQEKFETVEQSRGIHMSNWKAKQVLAWLELEMSMPMYGKYCVENIKSGKVLLGLSDSEMESALGISNPLHRRKLRLAVEEHREPALIKFPKMSKLDHSWVSQHWIHDLGLSQYSAALEAQLVDCRVLNQLSKKDLEKHLNIHRKFHQASIIHGIELLRRLNFNKEEILERRSQCESLDCDPLIWTNQRIIQWVQNIDLYEYADNLKDSGVHGGLMVLEPTFNSDAMATALGIPPSKSYVRRHLTTEFDSLVKPARTALESRDKQKKPAGGGSLGRAFQRSYRGGGAGTANEDEDGTKKRLSFRGSLGRAFGRRIKHDVSGLTIVNQSHGSQSKEHESTPV